MDKLSLERNNKNCTELKLTDNDYNDWTAQHILPRRFQKVKLVFESINHQFVIHGHVEVILISQLCI